MNSLLLNNGCLYGIYGRYLCSCYPIPLFSGSFPFLSPRPMVAVWLLLAILHSVALPQVTVDWRKEEHIFLSEHLFRLWPPLIKRWASDPSVANSFLGNFDLSLRREVGPSLDGIYIYVVAVCRHFSLSCAILCNINECYMCVVGRRVGREMILRSF